MLVHKSIDVRPEVWRRLRVNAELSGVAVRDYLTYLIEQAEPVPETDMAARAKLQAVMEGNALARRGERDSEAQENA